MRALSSVSTNTRRYILRRKTTNAENFPYTDDEQSSDEENLVDEDSSTSEEVYSSDEDEQPSIKGKKIRWSPSEDAHLQKYMKDRWKWSEIFAQFPYRTQGAVHLRGHMLRWKAERKSISIDAANHNVKDSTESELATTVSKSKKDGKLAGFMIAFGKSPGSLSSS